MNADNTGGGAPTRNIRIATRLIVTHAWREPSNHAHALDCLRAVAYFDGRGDGAGSSTWLDCVAIAIEIDEDASPSSPTGGAQ